jgi:hypothetical protein
VYGIIWGMLRTDAGLSQRAGVTLASLAAAALEGKRTTLAMSGIAVAGSCVWLIMTGQSRQVIRCGVCVLVGLAVGACFIDFESEFAQMIQLQLSGGFETLLSSASGNEVDETLDFRYNEIRIITDHFTAANPIWSVTGLGFGAEISPGWLDIGGSYTASGNLHHAHNSFAIYFLRHGLAGVSLLIWFIITVIFAPRGSLRSPWADTCIIVWLFALTLLMAGYTGNLMMEHLDLPMMAGLLLVLTQANPVPPLQNLSRSGPTAARPHLAGRTVAQRPRPAKVPTAATSALPR